MADENEHMVLSPIKIIVNNPPSKPAPKDAAFEDTLFLIELMKQQKQKEMRLAKDIKIQAMALEQKRKKEEKEGKSLRLH